MFINHLENQGETKSLRLSSAAELKISHKVFPAVVSAGHKVVVRGSMDASVVPGIPFPMEKYLCGEQKLDGATQPPRPRANTSLIKEKTHNNKAAADLA